MVGMVEILPVQPTNCQAKDEKEEVKDRKRDIADGEAADPHCEGLDAISGTRLSWNG